MFHQHKWKVVSWRAGLFQHEGLLVPKPYEPEQMTQVIQTCQKCEEIKETFLRGIHDMGALPVGPSTT